MTDERVGRTQPELSAELLDRYLTAECSPAECEFVSQWQRNAPSAETAIIALPQTLVALHSRGDAHLSLSATELASRTELMLGASGDRGRATQIEQLGQLVASRSRRRLE